MLWIDAAGVAEVVGVAPTRSYSGEQLTLSYELVNGDIAVSVVEDGVGVPPLLVEPTHSTGGVVGLELRGPQDVELFGQFDDFTWRTATGGTVVKGWTYNDMNQLTAIGGPEPESFIYDDIGRMTSRTVNGVETVFGYDRLDRLLSTQNTALSTSYAYAGASWMRNSATVNGTTTTDFVYDGSKVVTQTAGGVATHYLGLWERENAPTPTNLTHAIDGMGNITGIVGTGGYTQKFNFDAWGNFTATDGNGNPIAKTNGPRYRGYQYDAATDQYATGWRPYMPSLGRFGSLDPMGTPDGPNRYNYCGGDPVNRVDPMGTKWYQSHTDGVWFWLPHAGEPEIPSNDENDLPSKNVEGLFETALGWVAYTSEDAYRAWAKTTNDKAIAMKQEWAANERAKEDAWRNRKFGDLSMDEKLGSLSVAITNDYNTRKAALDAVESKINKVLFVVSLAQAGKAVVKEGIRFVEGKVVQGVQRGIANATDDAASALAKLRQTAKLRTSVPLADDLAKLSAPGQRGVEVGRRLSPEEMVSLTVKHEREFALVYKVGPGKAGGGGTYHLYSGDISSVRMPIGKDFRLIYHTHPAGTAARSPADLKLLQQAEGLGSPQRASGVIPVEAGPARVVPFGENYTWEGIRK